MVKTIKRTYCMFLIFLAELFSLFTPYCAAKPLDTAGDFPAKVVQQAQNARNQQPADYNINAKQDVSNIEPIKLGSINYEPVCIATPIQNDISGMKAAFSDFGVNVNRYCKQKKLFRVSNRRIYKICYSGRTFARHSALFSEKLFKMLPSKTVRAAAVAAANEVPNLSDGTKTTPIRFYGDYSYHGKA